MPVDHGVVGMAYGTVFGWLPNHAEDSGQQDGAWVCGRIVRVRVLVVDIRADDGLAIGDTAIGVLRSALASAEVAISSSGSVILRRWLSWR